MSHAYGRGHFRYLGTLLFAFAATPWVSAQQIVLNFDELAASSNFFPGDFIPVADRLSTGYLASSGVQFSSTGGYVGVMQLGIGNAVSGANGISSSTSINTVTYSSTDPLVAAFFDPANTSVPGITNFVSLSTDLQGNGINVTLQAFDINDQLIGSFATPDTGGTTLSLSVAGIHSVHFLGNGSSGVDDFTFNPVVAAVPEPGSLILAGVPAICLIGWCSRRALRRRCSK
jgi:hypothetical protein